VNDTPGWASPGSAPSDEQGSGTPGPADAPGPPAQWSPQQPPPGQWTPPTPPGGPVHPVPPQAPRPGWGAPPGPGGPGPFWGVPQAAKPGVIPLRPLGIGEILDGAVSTMRKHWRTVFSISIGVSAVISLLDILVDHFLLPAPPRLDPEADPSHALEQASKAFQSGLLDGSASLVVTLIGTVVTTALLTVVVSRSVLGRTVRPAEAWREAKPRLPGLLGLTLLLPLIGAGVMAVAVLPGVLIGSDGGLALAVLMGLAGIVVVIWLMIRFALAPPALMLERQGVIASMRRSAKLVNGSWWRTFGILLLTGLLTAIVSSIISVPFALIGTVTGGLDVSNLLNGENVQSGWTYLVITGIGAVIASAITYPISAGVTALLYVDQRIRREALDLELARAAGITGYGTGSPGI
jgi:Membrane domain of glycerophosphoryl diester phosphodiesterase